MRHAITLAQFHGEKHFRVLTDSGTPIEEQKKAFKELQRVGRQHPEYARIELWTSSNRAKSHKFKPVAAVAKTTPTPEKTPAPKTDDKSKSTDKDKKTKN